MEELKQPDQDAAAAGERGLRKKHRTLREEEDAGVVAEVGARRRKEVGSFGRVDSRERAREEVEREVGQLSLAGSRRASKRARTTRIYT